MTQAAILDTKTIVASLRQIMPPKALIDIGVGRGTGAMHQWRDWGVPAAWLVEAESAQLAWAEPLAAKHSGWRIHVATLAEADGQALYFRASNPAESGLVPTGKLATLWPNLREEEHAESATTRLDTLLSQDDDLPEGAGWWLIIDCLPAMRILQGAADTLERCSVLWLRALLQPLPESEAGTTLEDLQAFLTPLGFRCVQATEGNHPALGDALFVRNMAQQLQPVIAELQVVKEQCQQQYQQLEAQFAIRQTELDQLAIEKSELVGKLSAAEKTHVDLANKVASADKECAAKSEALATAQSETAVRAAERDAQAKRAAELQAKLTTLANERNELNSKFDALSKTHTELADKLNASVQQHGKIADSLKTTQAALNERTSERDAQTKHAVERQAKLEVLAKEKADLIAKIDALNKAHAEVTEKLAVSTREQSTVAQALKTAHKTLADRTSEHDTQTKLAAERQAKLEVLVKEKAELTAKLDALSEDHAELAEKLAASVQEKCTTAEALKTAHATLTERTGERDAQSKLATERQAKIDVLTKEKSELSAKLEGQIKLTGDLQAQLGAFRTEKTVLMEKLAASNKSVQQRTERSDMLQSQAEQLTKARDEQAKLATERANLITQLTGQRDKLDKESQSLKSEVQGKEAAIAKLHERIAAQDDRERQLVEEIVRAEAQIELIKDLLLREGGL